MTLWTDSGVVEAGGVPLEYACYGPDPSEALTLVLLHEGLGCVALWRDFPQRLAEATGLGVLVYSRAGYGQSGPAELPRPLDYMTREAVDVLPQVLAAFDVQKAVLVGHSDGGTIAAIYAGSVSDTRIRGLVLMAPHFFTEPMGLAEIERARLDFETGDLKRKMAKYHRDPEATFRGWNDAWLHPDFAGWNVADVIDYLRIPTLVIQGRDDPYGTMAQIDEVEDRSYAPVDRLELEGCGHAPFAEKPDQVLAAISEFTTRLIRIDAPEIAVA
ncbi:alpha/beta fold hydrolase [Flavimaricola marinus]|uniref:Acyl-CoA esterase n=1 Tax=Flavimaricola marinus TaxID=1819565 RepID=A0A238LB11_9RHOB|nr:alpha/beta hydrolase [Flavimaricola marinus]SMY06917.1 acyl-CoA esterase [Flavimaricola marinus]